MKNYQSHLTFEQEWMLESTFLKSDGKLSQSLLLLMIFCKSYIGFGSANTECLVSRSYVFILVNRSIRHSCRCHVIIDLIHNWRGSTACIAKQALRCRKIGQPRNNWKQRGLGRDLGHLSSANGVVKLLIWGKFSFGHLPLVSPQIWKNYKSSPQEKRGEWLSSSPPPPPPLWLFIYRYERICFCPYSWWTRGNNKKDWSRQTKTIYKKTTPHKTKRSR